MVKKYQNYIRNLWPLPFVQPWLYGPIKFAKEPFKYNFILCTRFREKSGWHYCADDLIALGHAMDKYLANSSHLIAFKIKAEKIRKENFDFSQNIKKFEINKLGLNELSALLRRWYLHHSKFCAMFMPIDATDETLEADIHLELKKSKLKISLQEIAYLLTPEAESYVQKENREFCNILKKNITNLSSSKALLSFKNYAEKWWWSPMGWGQHRPLTLKDINNRISKIKDIRKFIEDERQKEKQRKFSLKQKKLITKRLPKNVLNLLKAFEALAEMHDIRKEMQIRMMTAGFAITEEILKKSSLPVALRDFILIDEYLLLAKGRKINLKTIKSRKKYFWCQATSGGKISILSGKKALDKLNQSRIYLPATDNDKMVMGMSANPGKAKGVVRIGFNAKNLIDKFKVGEVLVTGMTTPDFFLAIKRAAAVVTDEGGITCHAAIISRELGIPCVIGTKIATKIFQDGDLIEIDAGRGVVRKLR